MESEIAYSCETGSDNKRGDNGNDDSEKKVRESGQFELDSKQVRKVVQFWYGRDQVQKVSKLH